jgi:hypothetical protein
VKTKFRFILSEPPFHPRSSQPSSTNPHENTVNLRPSNNTLPHPKLFKPNRPSQEVSKLQPATRRFRHSKRWRLNCPPPQDSPQTPILGDSLPAGPARAFSLSTSDEHPPAHLTPQMKSRFRNPAFPALNSRTLARVCLSA